MCHLHVSLASQPSRVNLSPGFSTPFAATRRTPSALFPSDAVLVPLRFVLTNYPDYPGVGVLLFSIFIQEKAP